MVDDWQKAIAPAEVLPQPAPKPRAPRVKREVHPVFVQIGSCLNGDPGTVEVHFYTVNGDVVTLTERNGKSLGKSAQIYEGQTAQTTARVMARALDKQEGNINRKIEYQSQGYA
ncbi:hypothetical protein [Tardiphaga sp. 709]|uniref:hypothetical protein n=1 Tax=Tardiphaga sp. 709 TaxID=3076039 RepID=UPI0028E4FCF6|nr:hypothetical protein [Tardiphaga sp. 709]WNV10169.1 hypothetical protein RSO67_02950 [Tardiphaga sp. 709]